ncbi:probable G-protein coupled receptor 139 [Heptranchias perlo]|uniref:probable G-protein coupled receptor 139 n=1 Tax=Heptranchias perlo TaxID=212740 RepID=UPI00355A0BAF
MEESNSCMSEIVNQRWEGISEILSQGGEVIPAIASQGHEGISEIVARASAGMSAMERSPASVELQARLTNKSIQALTMAGQTQANLMTIVVLSRGNCGLSKCITRYLLGMAVADLLVLIFEVVLYEIKDSYFPFSFLNYTPICSLNIALLFMSIDWSVWLTVAFTFDRFVAICHQTFSKKYCTEKTAAVVITVVCSLSLIENAPINFAFEPREIIDDVPWSCYVIPSFYTLTIWIAFTWFEIILAPFVPFLLILLFNAQTIRHIVQANRMRRGLRAKNNSEDHNDPEVENRRKSIVLLLTISASFMILWAVIFIFFMLVYFTEAQISETSYNAPFTIMEQTGYMLRSLSSCTNTFIYAVSQNTGVVAVQEQFGQRRGEFWTTSRQYDSWNKTSLLVLYRRAVFKSQFEVRPYS